MDLLTSSFHSDYGNNVRCDNNPAANMKFEFPDDLIDFECMLAGRKSFSTEGRDSLGILQNFETLVQPQLTLEPIQEVSFAAAENADVIRIFKSDDRVTCDDKRQSLNIQSVSNNLLNIAYRLSNVSSISSSGSMFRPSLWSLDYESEELSKIFSIHSRENVYSLNTAFYYSNKSDVIMENIENREKIDETGFNAKVDELNDTVFSDSQNVACIFDDGSILEDLSADLYSTHPPELIDITFDDELTELTEKNADVILKTVQILYPVENSADQKIYNEKSKNTAVNKLAEQKSRENLSLGNKKNDLLTLPQAPDVLNTSFSPKYCNNSGNCKDPRDLLNNLSNIISTEKIENQSQVKKILQDLADVLLVGNSKEANDDSGRSSIEENDVESLKYCSAENVGDVKELGGAAAKRLSQSFCFAKSSECAKVGPICCDRTRQRSLEDLKKGDVKKLSMPNVKLRVKRSDVDCVKKGPMKAVVPVANMKRRSVQTNKAETSPKNSYLKKRTSTPKMWNAVPVAQSTPEQLNRAAPSPKVNKSLQHSDGKNIALTNSYLSKSSSLNTSSKRLDLFDRSSSTSAPNISRGESPSRIPSSKSHLVTRRRSVSEIKYTANTSGPHSATNAVRCSGGACATGVRNNTENAHAAKQDKYGAEGARGSSKMDAKMAEKTSSVKSYLADRNRNLVQYIKPLNLLEKMKK